MQEKDITDANALYGTKRDIKWVLDKLTKEESSIRFQNQKITLRTSALEEMLQKELAYQHSRLRSLGIKEIS